MTISKYPILFFFVVVYIATAQMFGQVESSCTNSDFRGTFGFDLKGTNFSIGQFAIVGRMTADGNGHFTGSGVQSVNGKIAQSTFTGTYTVQADCTGTALMTFDTSGIKDSLSFVSVNDGNELLFLDIGGGTVETGSAKRQFGARPPVKVTAEHK